MACSGTEKESTKRESTKRESTKKEDNSIQVSMADSSLHPELHRGNKDQESSTVSIEHGTYFGKWM